MQISNGAIQNLDGKALTSQDTLCLTSRGLPLSKETTKTDFITRQTAMSKDVSHYFSYMSHSWPLKKCLCYTHQQFYEYVLASPRVKNLGLSKCC